MESNASPPQPLTTTTSTTSTSNNDSSSFNSSTAPNSSVLSSLLLSPAASNSPANSARRPSAAAVGGGGRFRSNSFKANEQQRQDALAAIAASLSAPASLSSGGGGGGSGGSSTNGSSNSTPTAMSILLSTSPGNLLSSVLNNESLPGGSSGGSDPSSPNADYKGYILPPRTPIDPPPFVFNWVQNPLAPESTSMPTSMDLNTGSGGSDSPNPTDNDNNVDDDDDDDNGEMIPAKASVLKEVDEEDMDDEVIEHAVTNDAQSSLFWSTWFDSEEQEMFDVNTMLQSVDFNAEQLDAWTNYGKSLSTNSFFGGNGSPSSSMGGMFGTGGDLNEDAIRDIIIKFLDLPRPIMQESLAQCLLMEGMVELFVGFITRPATPSENSDNSLSSKSSPTSLLTDFIDEDVLREREVVNEIESGDEAKFKEARRAFNATIVLCDGAGSAQSLLDRTFTRTVKSLLKIFDRGSKGSLRHFRKIFLELTRKNDRSIDIVLDTISTSTGRPYLIEMLRFCHDPAISECIMALIFHPTGSYNPNKRKEWYEKIMGMDFITNLLDLYHEKNYAQVLEGVSDLFSRIIEESSNITEATILFLPLMGESLAQMKGVEGIGFIGSTLVQLRKDLDECLASSAGDKSTSARHLISIRIRVFMECLHSLIIKSIPKPKVFSLSNIASMISSNLDEHQTEPIESEMPLHSIRSAVVNALSVNMDPFLQLLYLPSSSFSSSSAWNPAEKSPISTTSLLLGLDVLNEFIEFGTEIMVDEMGAIDKYLAFEDGRLNFNGQGVMGSNTTNHLGMMVLEAECISKIPFYRLFCWIFGAYSRNSIVSSQLFKIFTLLQKKRTIYWNICLKTLLVGDKGAGEFGLIQLIARDYEEKECSNRGFRHLICNLLRNACDEDTKLETKGVDGQESPLLSTLQEIEEWNRIEPIVSKESEQHEKGIWSSSMKNNLKNASVETMSGDGDGVGSSSDFSSDSSLYKLPAMKLPPAPKNLSRNNSGPMASSSSNATPAKIAAVKAIEDELSPMINNLLDSINAATKL